MVFSMRPDLGGQRLYPVTVVPLGVWLLRGADEHDHEPEHHELVPAKRNGTHRGIHLCRSDFRQRDLRSDCWVAGSCFWLAPRIPDYCFVRICLAGPLAL